MQIDVRLCRGGLERQDEEGQKLKRHVKHGRHWEENLVGRAGPKLPRAGRNRGRDPSVMFPSVWAVEAGMSMPRLMACHSAGRPG